MVRRRFHYPLIFVPVASNTGSELDLERSQARFRLESPWASYHSRYFVLSRGACRCRECLCPRGGTYHNSEPYAVHPDKHQSHSWPPRHCVLVRASPLPPDLSSALGRLALDSNLVADISSPDRAPRPAMRCGDRTGRGPPTYRSYWRSALNQSPPICSP